MAPSPFGRRKAAKTARNLALAEAALALARDRATGAGSRRRGGGKGKLLLIGGAVVAAGAAAMFKRDKVAGLLPSRTGEPEPATTMAPPPPQPSNYDAPGPVANTATPIPAPDTSASPAVDEAAEEAAAAAEAAAIGGTPEDYSGPALDEPADAAYRPLAEAGGGEAEGQELAEADLAANATYRDAGMTDAERQIEDTIEQAGRPGAGETPEPLAPTEPGPAEAETRAHEPAGTQGTFLPPNAQPAPPTGTGFGAGTRTEETAGAQPAPGGETRTGEGAPQPDTSGAPQAPATGSGFGTGTRTEETAGAQPAPGGETRTGEPPATGAPPPDAPAAPPIEAPGTGTPPEDTPVGDSPAPEREEDDDSDWRTWSGRSVNP